MVRSTSFDIRSWNQNIYILRSIQKDYTVMLAANDGYVLYFRKFFKFGKYSDECKTLKNTELAVADTHTVCVVLRWMNTIFNNGVMDALHCYTST